jgi:hypothetical protein
MVLDHRRGGAQAKESDAAKGAAATTSEEAEYVRPCRRAARLSISAET